MGWTISTMADRILDYKQQKSILTNMKFMKRPSPSSENWQEAGEPGRKVSNLRRRSPSRNMNEVTAQNSSGEDSSPGSDPSVTPKSGFQWVTPHVLDC